MSKNIFNFFKDFLPEGFFYTVVALFAITFILYYLYRTSEFFGKKKVNISIIVTIFLFLLSNLILWLTQRPIEPKKRLAIYPIDVTQCAEKDKWMGWAIAELVGNYFQQDATSEMLIYPPDWLLPIINPDSLEFDLYLKSFSNRLGVDYYFSGRMFYQDSSYFLCYRLYSSDNFIDSSKITINLSDYNFGLIIARTIKKHLPIKIKINNSNWQNIEQFSLKNYILGKHSLLKSEPSEAKDYFELAINYDSSFVNAWTYLAATNLQLGLNVKKNGHSPIQFYSDAKNCLETAQKLDNHVAQNNQFYAKYYILVEKWDHAETKLRQMIKQNPYNPYSYLLFAQLHSSRYMDLGFENEEKLLRHALSLFPGFVEAAISLSDYYYNYLQDSKKAIEVLQQFLAINPNQIALLLSLGKLYIAANQALPVMATFKKVIEFDPNNSNAYYNLGIFYFNSKDYETALKLFERAIKIDGHLDSHLYIAYIYEKMSNKTEESSSKHKEYFDKAIKHFRLRIRNRRGQADLYAETARKHLFHLLHR